MERQNTNEDTNEELNDLATHQAGITDLHKTRHTHGIVQIDPPKVSPGPHDTRTGNYETNMRSKARPKSKHFDD